MKNPTIKASLNKMMLCELKEKKEAITAIIDAYKTLGTPINEFDLICELWELHLSDISQILGDLISDLHSEICVRFGSQCID